MHRHYIIACAWPKNGNTGESCAGISEIKANDAIRRMPISVGRGGPHYLIAPLRLRARRLDERIQFARIVPGDGAWSRRNIDQAPILHRINMGAANRADRGIKKDTHHRWQRIDGRAVNGVGTDHKRMGKRHRGALHDNRAKICQDAQETGQYYYYYFSLSHMSLRSLVFLLHESDGPGAKGKLQ